MGKKNEFCLMKADINQNYKDQLLIELSNLNLVQIKPKVISKKRGEIKDKKPIVEKINSIRKNLNTLFKRLIISDIDIKKFRRISRKARIKLELLTATGSLEGLKVPPGNRLEALKGKRKGQYSIRVDSQWRVCFKWVDGNAYDVEIVDYH